MFTTNAMFSNEIEQRNDKLTNDDVYKNQKNNDNKPHKKNYDNKQTITNETCKNTQLNILYTNLDSLSNKLNELETHAELYNSDLILITEHLSKNTSSHFSDVYNLDGYKSFEDISGRGVIVFYKE